MNIARFPNPVFGRIPKVESTGLAVKNLTELEEFLTPMSITCDQDSPQRMVRFNILSQGKNLLMAAPRLRGCFLLLTHNRIRMSEYLRASSISGAFSIAEKISPYGIPKIDLIVIGPVVVTKGGIASR